MQPSALRPIDQLSELLSARRALIKDRTAALARGKTLTLALLKRQNQCHLRQIEAQIRAIDQAQAAILANHPALQARLDILRSVPGLGDVTALALLIDMPELGSLDGKQAASLAGVAPMTRQSGRWQGISRIQGGRRVLRQAIYMPALVAIRFNPPLKAKYLALRQAGKPAKVAIVAIMRKLIITANALLRDNRRWEAAATVGAAWRGAMAHGTRWAVDGTQALLASAVRGQAPQPRSGASQTPGLRAGSGRRTMHRAVQLRWFGEAEWLD